MTGPTADELAVIENEFPERSTRLTLVAPEFTCLCPEGRNHPDFATVVIEYVPDEHIIELKSLKEYLISYRDVEIYHESGMNRILDHLVDACEPRWLRITGRFNTRGGISTDVVVEHGSLTEEVPSSEASRTTTLDPQVGANPDRA